LVAVLQAGLKVKRYIYVDVDEAARQATSAIKTSFSTFVGDIALVSAEDIHHCGHVDLVIAGWSC
jgi:hypothetical protein